MSFVQVFLITLAAGIASVDGRMFGYLMLNRPVVLGPIVGLILGDLKTGLFLGASLEMIWMGVMRVGGSVPPNIVIGGVLGTAFAITGNMGVEAALLIAVPASLVGSSLEVFIKTICSFFVRKSEAYAKEANTKGIALMVHLGNLLYFLSGALPVFIALQFGGDAVLSLLNMIPENLVNSLKVAGKVLPVLGFGVLLNSVVSFPLVPFFFIGFILAAFMKVSIIGVAVLAIAIAFLIQYRSADSREA
jgi:fructoselysine and glucoselysine-specific PTS system IIC component